MKLYRRNSGGYQYNKECWNLIENIVENIENETHGYVPNVSEIIDKLQKGGWGNKIRLAEGFAHSLDGILEGVGVVVSFGHSGASYQKLLTMQSMYIDCRIKEGYYISQTRTTSELRHRLVNPKAKPGTNGNRITAEDLNLSMDYYHRFITVPLAIIGMQIDENSINSN